MVDNAGEPLLFFHGTTHDFEQFNEKFIDASGTDISTNYLGFYFTTSSETSRIYISKRFDPRYGEKHGGKIRTFILDIKKPYFITEKTYWKWARASSDELIDVVDTLKMKGYRWDRDALSVERQKKQVL
jgi:hypothetical protein